MEPMGLFVLLIMSKSVSCASNVSLFSFCKAQWRVLISIAFL